MVACKPLFLSEIPNPLCKAKYQSWPSPLHLAYLAYKEMPYTLHSLSIYEEIIAHSYSNMMTKLTDCVVSADSSDYFGAKERSEAFREAWISATEATLLESKETKLQPSD